MQGFITMFCRSMSYHAENFCIINILPYHDYVTVYELQKLATGNLLESV